MKYLFSANKSTFTNRLPSSIKTLATILLLPFATLVLTACDESSEAENKTTEVKTAKQSIAEIEKSQAQQAQLAAQQAQIEAQKAQIEAQKIQIEAEKSKQLEAKKAPEPKKIQPQKPKSKATNSPKLSMKAEESMAIINDFFEENGRLYVKVDFVRYVEPSDTNAGAIKNTNPKLRIYEVHKSEYPLCMNSGTESVDSIRTEWEALRADEPIYDIQAKNGKVIRMNLSCTG